MSIISGPGDWNGWAGPEEETGRAAIVVTAPAGALVTVTVNGSVVLSQPWTGPVVYYPPAYGNYAVSAVLGPDLDQKTIVVNDDLTYYAGLVFTGPIILTASGPSGASVTVTGNGFTQTKVIV